MTETRELVAWLREHASGPMAMNPEHTDTCNMLAKCADALEHAERLRVALKDIAAYDGGSLQQGICAYGCDAPNIAQLALKGKYK